MLYEPEEQGLLHTGPLHGEPQMAAATPACDRTLAMGAADLRLGFLIALSSLGIM